MALLVVLFCFASGKRPSRWRFCQQDKDKFGNDVTFLARPLPVEYLIIDVSSFSPPLRRRLPRARLWPACGGSPLSFSDHHHVPQGPPVHLQLHSALPHREPRNLRRDASKGRAPLPLARRTQKSSPISCAFSPQNFHSLATYLSQCASASFLDIVSDFHLLLFLVTNEVMPLRVSWPPPSASGRRP